MNYCKDKQCKFYHILPHDWDEQVPYCILFHLYIDDGLVKICKEEIESKLQEVKNGIQRN